MHDTCATCRHWVRNQQRITDPSGECRRYPPTTIQAQGGVITSYPRTTKVHWCGEWARRRRTGGEGRGREGSAGR